MHNGQWFDSLHNTEIREILFKHKANFFTGKEI